MTQIKRQIMQPKRHKLLFLLLLFFASLFCNLFILSNEFLYPVAAITQSGKTKIYVLHQKSINNIELWVWDPETKLCSKGLLSSYTPASLKILPDCDGFSFIDEARIRIKKFDKRSPKSIDIYEPLYDISQLNWIDEHNFYVSAKKNNKFCIFHINENGLIKSILEDSTNSYFSGQDLPSSDLQDLDLSNCDSVNRAGVNRNCAICDRVICNGVNRDNASCESVSYDSVICESVNHDFMYPQKVGNNLFYIERIMQEVGCKKEHVSYKIAKTLYPDLCLQMQSVADALENSEDFDVKTKKLQEFTDNCEPQKLAKKNCQYSADFKNNPIAFLNMISEAEGFFLKHPENICKHDAVVTFECFRIKFDGRKDFYNNDLEIKNCENKNSEACSWTCVNIFSFSVPAYLILEVPDSCLYESILPLLPKYYNGKIYYVNFDTKKQSLNLCSYNLNSNKTEKVSFFSGSHFLGSQLLFSPVFLENTIFCGGKIDYSESCPVKMWINDENCICMDLPKILV